MLKPTGTSVPDALSSLFVAQDGEGDMAVSNAIGSNVFDILMGLGLPWTISAAITFGAPVHVCSKVKKPPQTNTKMLFFCFFFVASWC
jgi:Ca2+/Na+ antiporter